MSMDHMGRNIASYAISRFSVHIDTLAWIAARLPELLTAKDINGQTIFHHAAKVGSEDAILYLLTKHPHIISAAWVHDNNGNGPNAVASPWMSISPDQICRALLRLATERLTEGAETSNDIALLTPFRHKWENLLLKNSAYLNQKLLTRAPNLPSALKKILENLSIRDDIVSHVTTKFGVLYWLIEDKLPLHTDHTPVSDGDAYRQTLHRLVINFFGAAELCHNKGQLDEFCGKVSVGYCLEGRIRDTFEWAASLDNIVSLDHTMAKFVHHEYLPYALVMHGIPSDSIYVEDAARFITNRHLNALCLPHHNYAPDGKITLEGVTNYMKDILDYENSPLLLKIEAEIIEHRKQVEGQLVFNKGLKQLKVKALVDLKINVIQKENYTFEDAVYHLYAQYPRLAKRSFVDKIRGIFEGNTVSRHTFS